MKSKSISYNTDEPTKQKVVIAAKAKGTSVAEIVRVAIQEFADSVEPRLDRTEALTVILDPNVAQILQDAADKTGLRQSAVIHHCLSMYVLTHKEEIQQSIRQKLEHDVKVLAA